MDRYRDAKGKRHNLQNGSEATAFISIERLAR
jgi:hypothetical protein